MFGAYYGEYKMFGMKNIKENEAEMGGLWAELNGGNEPLYKYSILLPHFRNFPSFHFRSNQVTQ